MPRFNLLDEGGIKSNFILRVCAILIKLCYPIFIGNRIEKHQYVHYSHNVAIFYSCKVNLQKHKAAKEHLIQYKEITQNNYVEIKSACNLFALLSFVYPLFGCHSVVWEVDLKIRAMIIITSSSISQAVWLENDVSYFHFNTCSADNRDKRYLEFAFIPQNIEMRQVYGTRIPQVQTVSNRT